MEGWEGRGEHVCPLVGRERLQRLFIFFFFLLHIRCGEERTNLQGRERSGAAWTGA